MTKNNTFNDWQQFQSIVLFHCQKSDNWSYQTEKEYLMLLLEALGQIAIPYSFRFSLILFTYSSKIGISVSLLTVSWGHSQLPETSLLPCAVSSFVIKTTRENYFSPILGKSPFSFPPCFSKLCSCFLLHSVRWAYLDNPRQPQSQIPFSQLTYSQILKFKLEMHL